MTSNEEDNLVLFFFLSNRFVLIRVALLKGGNVMGFNSTRFVKHPGYSC